MRNRVWTSLLIVAIISLVAFLVWWYPRLKAGNPTNPLPTVSAAQGAHVSEQVCGSCHADQAKDYQSSGHSNTFHISLDSEIARRLDGQKFDDPERPYTYEYHFEETTGLWVSIPKLFGEDRFRLPYLLGSGQHALTFLSLASDRYGDTTGIEHRISLYRNNDEWELDLTPGHRLQVPSQAVEQFGKVVRGDRLTSCVACHTTQGEIVRQQIENLAPHVGCQSCHGPGREHVTAMEGSGQDEYSSFSKQSAQEEVELCGRCHRLAHSESGAEVSANDIRNVRFQSVGLLQTRCYTESEGRFRCTTCHDPHQTVSRDAAHYVDRCLNCHGETDSKSCPVSPQTDCIRCHMPAFDIHRGIKFHDHWIRVRSDLGDATATQAGDE
ncbi:MAG: hypothetical protein KDB05_14700 [Planctomycetales bacterium]|nr:hypothetical protein [Planctomycetales bacterium]